jgi:hypothetical protein
MPPRNKKSHANSRVESMGNKVLPNFLNSESTVKANTSSGYCCVNFIQLLPQFKGVGYEKIFLFNTRPDLARLGMPERNSHNAATGTNEQDESAFAKGERNQ